MNPEDPGIFMLLAFVGGILGRPLITYLKERYCLEDKKALSLAVGVSFILAIVHALMTGTLSLTEFDPTALMTAMGVIYSTAQVIYKWTQLGELEKTEDKQEGGLEKPQ